MMQSYTLIGRVGHDASIRYTPKGVAVTNFDMAVTRTWTDASGEKHEETEWPRITVWGNLAEVCAEHVKKGMVVGVKADRFTVEAWAKKATSEPAARVVFHAQEVKFLSWPKNGGEEGNEAERQRPSGPARAASANGRKATAPAFGPSELPDEDDF